MATVHVIGAGLAGLSAAVRLANAGRRVAVAEATDHAGGRCRSYRDAVLDRAIDNGNHLILSGNRSAMAYLADTGARDTLLTLDEAAFPFVDLATGRRWTVRMNRGRLPWWIAAAGRRVPDSGVMDYLEAGYRLARAGPEDTVTGVLDTSRPLFQRFWQPMAVAVLNTEVECAAAHLLWPVLTETFARGGAACLPCLTRDGLSPSLVDPALKLLADRSMPVRFNRRLKSLSVAADRVDALVFGDETVRLAADDTVVLALPATTAAGLLPDLTVPESSRPIVNAHFRLAAPPARPIPFLGMLGGTAEWLFLRGDVVSVTVSAASALADVAAEEVAEALWRDVAAALELDGGSLPPHRIIKERRATFAQTPAEVARRPAARTRWRNLVLAGDWTDTGLPATIEGAIRSGHTAADVVLNGRTG